MTDDTPLGRAADVLRRELQDYIPGLDFEEMDRFTHKLASDVLGAAALPEQLDVATELRTANLIALGSHIDANGYSDSYSADMLGIAIDRLGLSRDDGTDKA